MTKVTLDIDQESIELYGEYCKLFETTIEDDLSEYLEARAKVMKLHMEKYKNKPI